jgi:hypothetical protein
MQVLRENDDSFGGKWPFAAGFPERVAQALNVVDQHRRPPVTQRYREEKHPTGDEIAPIADHGARLPRIALRFIRATGYGLGKSGV